LTFHNFGYAANPAKQFAEGDEVLVFPARLLVPTILGEMEVEMSERSRV